MLYVRRRADAQPLLDTSQPGRVRVRLTNHPEPAVRIRMLNSTTIGAWTLQSAAAKLSPSLEQAHSDPAVFCHVFVIILGSKVAVQANWCCC